MKKLVALTWMTGCLAGLSLLAAGSAEGLGAGSDEKASIVFSNGGRIYSMKADGSDRRVLTDFRAGEGEYDDGDSSPEVSPDGRQLLFIRSNENQDDVYQQDLMVADPDGTAPKSILTTNSDNDGGSALFSATWSADGSQIYFLEFSYEGDLYKVDVAAVNADGTGRHSILQKAIDFSFLDDEDANLTFKDLEIYTDIDPSPDGSKLLVGSTGLFGHGGVRSKLRVLDLATGNLTKLQNRASGGAWSPDGSRIAFVSQRDHLNEDCYETSCDYDSRAYVMKADGSNPHRLLSKGGSRQETQLDWSPDGGRILLSSDRNTSFEIYSVRPDGKCLTWLTNGSPDSSSAKWVPGGGDSSSSGCGADGRKPLSEVVPEPRPSVGGQVPFWLGPVYGGMMPSYFSYYGDYNQYSDCTSYKPSVCRKRPEVFVSTENVCRSNLHFALVWGHYKGMTKRRGAIVVRSDMRHRPDELMVSTGKALVTIEASGPRFSGSSFKPFLKAFRSLRIAGQDRPARHFNEGRLSRRDVKKAYRIERMVKRAGSARALADNSRKLTGPEVHAYLRFAKDIDRMGGVKTVSCPGRRHRGSGLSLDPSRVLPAPAMSRTVSEPAGLPGLP